MRPRHGSAPFIRREFAIRRTAERSRGALRAQWDSNVCRLWRSARVSELTSGSKNVDISIDPFTGRNPSYCFVDFNTTHDAIHALHVIGNEEIRGRPVKINSKTAKRDPIYHENNRNRSRRAFSDGVDEKSGMYAFDRWTQHDAVEHWTAPVEEGRRLYVGGLPRMPDQGTVNVEMRELFRNFNVQAVSKVIWPHPSTKHKPGDHHYCFVDLLPRKRLRRLRFSSMVA